jgi:hypothetical protein
MTHSDAAAEVRVTESVPMIRGLSFRKLLATHVVVFCVLAVVLFFGPSRTEQKHRALMVPVIGVVCLVSLGIATLATRCAGAHSNLRVTLRGDKLLIKRCGRRARRAILKDFRWEVAPRSGCDNLTQERKGGEVVRLRFRMLCREYRLGVGLTAEMFDAWQEALAVSCHDCDVAPPAPERH